MSRLRIVAWSITLVLVLSGALRAGVLSFGPALTDDASTGIGTSNTYTHAISGGEAQNVNGVAFSLLNPGTTPANFVWNSFDKDVVTNNNNNWNPATGGVTGLGVQALLNDFTYSGEGDEPGSLQTFTLSGLTPGTLYDARLYIRAWDQGGSGRPIDLTFTNGAEVDIVSILEDRPVAQGFANNHEAYYLSYLYLAQGSTLTIDAAVPLSAGAASGSLHLYALTNQVAPVPEPGALALAAMGLLGVGLVGWRRRLR